MTTYEFEEQDKSVLMADVDRITRAAVDAGRSYRVRLSKDGDWWKATITVEDAA